MTDPDEGDGALKRVATGVNPNGDGSLGAGWPELREHDVGAATAAHIRRRALATLRRREIAAQTGAAKIWLWYERAVEPTLWLGLGLGYCAWAAAGALAILH